ncbi:anillin isoform X2 [Nilaparvata lugens]|uniref:anillin isoform X2 n=1 Tax=Nilaparvata lugens TaxID=108931 RepID=UPI00193E0B10|nr:anillin isoform X2 [Nilaparvata lugens]
MDKSFNDRLLKRLADRTKAIDEKLAAAMSNNRRVVKEQSSPSREVKKTEIYTTSVKTTTRIDYFDEQTETEASSGEDMLCNEKENAKPNIQAKHNEMVNRLKKLDKIYKNDDDVNASPPRRRTEENFKVEDEEITESDSGLSKSSNSSSKLAVKLAALADTINQREDDLRHVASKEAQGFERCESHSNLAYDYRKGEKDKQMKQTPETSSKVKEAIEKCNDRDSRAASPVISPSMSPARGMSPSRLGSPIRMVTPQLIESTNSPTKFIVKPVLGISGLKSPKAGPSSTVTSALKTSTATSGSKTSTATSALKSSTVTSALKTSTSTSALKSSTATSALTTSTVTSAVGSAPLKSVTTKPDSLIKNSPARSSVRQLSNLYESSSNLSPKKPDPAELPLAQRKALFEKNRGAPVMPKPIGFENKPNQAAKPSARPCKPVMPTTTLSKTQQTKKCNRSEREERGLSSVVAIFEQGPGPGIHGGPDHIHKAQQERQREIDMLKQRWETQKLAQESIVPAPPPLPCDSPMNGSLRQRGVTFSPTYEVEEYDDEFSYDDIDEDDDRSISPVKSPKDYPGLKDTKPIKISPPKPGHLYPNLSDMEVESDAPQSDFDEMIDYYERKQQAEENEKLNSSIESETSGDSLGRIIMGTAKKSLSRSTLNSLKRDLHMSSSSDSMDDSVTQENNNLLNEFLDEALDDDDESVTPPKRSRSSFEKDVSSLASHSFEYQQTSSRGQFSNPSGNSETPLQHTISFYRRNQTLSNKTPISPRRQFVNNGYDDDRDVSSDDDNNKQQEAVEKKIQELQQEIIRQEAIISQASQALNLCIATIEFSSSTEQIEAERLLLVATHKRQALVHEVQRLKVEKTLRPLGPDNAKLTEQGDLTLNSITLPLKLDNIRAAARDEKCVHLICLVKCGAQVISTCMQSTNPRNLHDTNRLTFPKSITLEGLYSDFKVAIEVYGLATKSKELLPHEIKYHIAKSKKDANKHGLTPKKSKHQDDKLVRPIFQSMGGPNAVRSPQFSLIGYVVFSLREINRTHFTLNKVPYTSVLEGTIHLKMNCEMTIDIVHRGFLTMFDDICGMGAWHRRWSQLQGDKLSYWKYPEDEKKRIPNRYNRFERLYHRDGGYCSKGCVCTCSYFLTGNRTAKEAR